MIKPFKILPALLFFLFICYVIYTADRDHDNWLLRLPGAVPFGDKVGHFLLYGIMGWLANIGLNHRAINVRKRKLPTGSLLVVGFAIVEEFTQLAFPSRTFDWADMLCDILGISLFSGRILFQRVTPTPYSDPDAHTHPIKQQPPEWQGLADPWLPASNDGQSQERENPARMT